MKMINKEVPNIKHLIIVNIIKLILDIFSNVFLNKYLTIKTVI